MGWGLLALDRAGDVSALGLLPGYDFVIGSFTAGGNPVSTEISIDTTD